MYVNVKVPATSANLGPGFDSMGLALGLYNEFDFCEIERGLEIEVEGEGTASIPQDKSNLIVQAACRLCEAIGRELPPVRIVQRNYVPSASGLGSSSTAVMAGLLGANALLGSPLSKLEILQIATEMEGHPDNVAPALYGGLVLVPMGVEPLHVEKIPIQPLKVVVVVPEFSLLTADARAALPPHVSRADAIFNLARTPLVVRALEQGDYRKLGIAMEDRLHQPYRMGLVPGMAAVFAAARGAGAAAVAVSGAGPSVIAFAPQGHMEIGRAMQGAFEAAGLKSRMWALPLDQHGSIVSRDLSNSC